MRMWGVWIFNIKVNLAIGFLLIIHATMMVFISVELSNELILNLATCSFYWMERRVLNLVLLN